MSDGKSGTLCLALCSATRTASVALLEGTRVLCEHSAQTDRHQAESLLPLVDRVLQGGGARIEDLAGIGLSIGPGSFTSLRVGVATVKGLVFGTSIPVVAVSSLQALAEASGCGDDSGAPIIATLNAQRGEVYAAAFSARDDGFGARPDVLPELVYGALELAERLPTGSRLVGDGTCIVALQLRERRGDDLVLIEDRGLEPEASSIGRLAVAQLELGQGKLAMDLAPRYVRRAEAEVARTSERFEPPAC